MIDYEELVSKSHQLFFVRIKEGMGSFYYPRHRFRGNKVNTCLIIKVHVISIDLRDFPHVIRENPISVIRLFPIAEYEQYE